VQDSLWQCSDKSSELHSSSSEQTVDSVMLIDEVTEPLQIEVAYIFTPEGSVLK
jgi:hypothetical protein